MNNGLNGIQSQLTARSTRRGCGDFPTSSTSSFSRSRTSSSSKCRPKSARSRGSRRSSPASSPSPTPANSSPWSSSPTPRRAQVLGRRVPGARPHLLRAAEVHAASAHPRGRGRGEAGQGDHRAGGVPRRAAAHDRQGDLRHQRRRARDREPAPSLTGRVLRRERPPQRQAAVLGAHHSRTAARGSSSRSTSTTSCTSTSTASASCRSPCCSRPWVTPPKRRSSISSTRSRRSRSAAAAARRTCALEGRVVAEDVVDTETGEVLVETNEELSVDEGQGTGQERHQGTQGLQHPAAGRGRRHPQHAQEGPLHRRGGRAGPHLPTCCVRASRRAASPRAKILNRLFFNPKRYDLAKVGRYKLNQKLNHVELLGGAARMKTARRWPRRRTTSPSCPPRTSSPSSSTCSCCGPAGGNHPGVDHRRHRPSGQPPRPLGRRAARQPVQHRSDPHGPHHPRADESAGLGAGHAVRPDQRPDHLAR